MAVKEILVWPNPILNQKSERIEHFDSELRSLVRDLIETMVHRGEAAGLAATQIGVLKRVFIADIPPEHNDGDGTNGPEAFINPEFIERQGSFEWQEGCLSVLDEYGECMRGPVMRSDKIVMRYQDLDGKVHTRKTHGYLSGCFQHEADHLDGILWVDHQSRLRRNMLKKKALKYHANHQR